MSWGEENEPEPRPLVRTNSLRIIVFYRDTGEVEVESIEVARKIHHRGTKSSILQSDSTNLIAMTASLTEPRDKAPKMGKWVNVYENGRNEEIRGLLLTTLNLSKLGWANSCRRLVGRCNDIYVLNRVESTSTMTTATMG